MCAGPDVEVTRGGTASARRSAVPAVPGGASPNPKDARFSPARDDARNRAAAANAAARALAVPLVPIPSVAPSPDARIAPLGSDPPRSPDAARTPPARNLDRTAARSRADPNHDRNRTARDPNRAAARRVVASDESSPVSRVFVHADRRPHDRVDAILENVPRACCSPAAKRPRSSLGSADDAGLATPPSPPFGSVDPPDDDDDDDDTPIRKRRAGEAFPPVPASPAVAMDFASLLDLLDGAPASLANDHHPTLDDMDASDASDAFFDRRMSVDGVNGDETSPPSPRRTVDDAIRETVCDALDLDLPRDRDHHRSSLSLSTRAGVPATAPGRGWRRRDSSRSSLESDATRAPPPSTNDCAHASSAPPRKSTTRPATPSRDGGARLVATLEPQLDLDLDARCLLARAEDEEDAADGRRLRESGVKSRLPRGSTLNASAPAFAPATVHSVPRASCGREIQPPRFCALVPVPRERREMWTGIGGVLPAAAEVLRVLDGMRRKQDVEGVPAFA